MQGEELTITGPGGKWLRELFFCLGLIGAIGLRLVLILNSVNPFWAKVSSYTAVISLTAYYYYRLWIENKRRAIITENQLLQKLAKNNLTEADRKKIATIINSQMVSKQYLNLNILFWASIVALVLQLVIDLKIIKL